ncbi:MAG: hypothetical protein ACP5OE_09240 [Thermodesulfobium sp.]
MSKEIAPSWLVKRYMKLWNKFKDKDFSFEEAQKTLKEDNKFLSVVLSEMKKEGWLNLELDPEDARKRLYKLLSLEEVMKKTAEKAVNIFKTENQETVQKASINIGGNVTSGRDTNIESKLELKKKDNK